MVVWPSFEIIPFSVANLLPNIAQASYRVQSQCRYSNQFKPRK